MPANESAQRIRRATITLRVQVSVLHVIDRAAAATGKSRTEFMVEAARNEAEAVLLDRCNLGLDDQSFAAFIAALDQRPSDNPRLRRLLRAKACWE